MLRAICSVGVLLSLLTGSRAPGAPAAGAAPAGSVPQRVAAVVYSAPAGPPVTVVRGFEPPPSRYAAGHRGVDLAVTAGEAVRAAADGRVTFAGTVAERGVVVIAHADGVRTEYEPVRPTVRAGMIVGRGALIGRVHGTHDRCAPNRCLHWGARRGDGYFDPLSLLRPLGPVRLLPWNSSADP
jgi:murein DD-endopeptidase MepM/ murein hydrolase activator NlpD